MKTRPLAADQPEPKKFEMQKYSMDFLRRVSARTAEKAPQSQAFGEGLMTETDPAVKTGRFSYEVVPWLGPKSLGY